MNIKKIILLLVILGLLGYGAFYFLSKSDSITLRCEEGFRYVPSSGTCEKIINPEDEVNTVDFSEVIISVPGSLATLSLKNESGTKFSGTYTDPDFPTSKGYVSIDSSDVVEYSTDLIFVPFLLNSGGTGNFIYVALIDRKNNQHLSSVFVGDRVGVDSIVTVGQIAKINYKTRLGSEGYGAAPTIPAQIVVEVRDRKLAQLVRLQNTDYGDIEIKSPLPGVTLNGEFVLRGAIPGTWYFEGIANWRILDDGLSEIAMGPLQAKADWMTTQRVPFETRISTTNFNYSGNATVVIESPNNEGGEIGERLVKRIEVPVFVK